MTVRGAGGGRENPHSRDLRSSVRPGQDRGDPRIVGTMIHQAAARRGEMLPKLVTTLREGYGPPQLRADLVAGLTVAIVALPLSMAIAIASGVTPERGLYTAIVGGFLVSALGGSRFQIGGPAGAFIVLVAATVAAHGVEGLVLATMLSGLMLMAAGALGLGTYIKFIPYPVTVGFTAGIATIIFASQIVPLLGLTLAGVEPGPLVAKLGAIRAALPTVNPTTLALSLAAIAGLVALKRLRPHWPRMLIVVALAAVAAALLRLPVATIDSAFGGIPEAFPGRRCRGQAWTRCSPSCRTHWASRCSGRSNRFCRRWWRTG